MGRTIAEKILANHSGQPARAGDIVLADLDFIMGQDGTSPLAIDVFRQMGGVKVAEQQSCPGNEPQCSQPKRRGFGITT